MWNIILFFTLLVPGIAAETCLGEYQLAGIIFGAIFGTLLICVGFSFILWFLMHSATLDDKNLVFEKRFATRVTDGSLSESADLTDRGISTDRVDVRDHISVRDKGIGVSFPTPKPRHSKAIEDYLSGLRRRARSLEFLPIPKDDTLSAHIQRILRGLGFSIDRNDSYGVYVKDILPDGPAEKSRNIFSGDRIRLLTISFDNMKYEDAIAILALVTPYTIRLDLEREAGTVDDSTEIQTAQMIITKPPKKSPSVDFERPTQLKDRGCLSLERLNSTKLIPPRKSMRKRVETGELDLEEKQIIHIVRHTLKADHFGNWIPRIDSISEGETYELIRGIRQIQKGGYSKKVHEFLDMRTSRAVQMPSPTRTSSSSVSSEASAPVFSPAKKPTIFATDASIHVTDDVQVNCEEVSMPISTPSPPPEEETFIPIRIVEPTVFYSESEFIKPPLPEPLPPPPPPITIHMHVDPKRKPMVKTEVQKQQPRLIRPPPGFIEMRAKKIVASEAPRAMPIIDRRVPHLPPSALETDVIVQRGGQEGENLDLLYKQIRENLNKTYESRLESKKLNVLPKEPAQTVALSLEQHNMLETNRRRLEQEKQQLRDLGII